MGEPDGDRDPAAAAGEDGDFGDPAADLGDGDLDGEDEDDEESVSSAFERLGIVKCAFCFLFLTPAEE